MKITSKNVFTVEDGNHTVAPNLILVVRGNTRRFVFRYSENGKRTDKALGPARKLSLSDAKALADELRSKLALGEEIKTRRERKEKENTSDVPVFKTYAIETIDRLQEVKRWRNKKHAQQWRNTIEQYAFPFIGEKPINEITREDVLNILKPIWLEKNETASRVRGRLENVLAYAVTDGILPSNPATWRGNLDRYLAPQSKVKVVKHHEAMPFEQLQEKVKCLIPANNRTRQVILFTILTASRIGESVPACWNEIDLKNRVWSVPPERRKDGKPFPHRVPLSTQAIDLLNSIERQGEKIFEDPDRKASSRYSLTGLLKRMTGTDATMHGFRSTFRDWCAENDVPEILAEKSMMHQTGDAVVQAYQRSDLLEQRREVMQRWADAVFEKVED
jgi:integrase